MQVNVNSKCIARSGIVARRIGEQTLLVPVFGDGIDSKSVFALNPVAEFAWTLFDGEHSLAQVHREIVAEFDVSETEAQSDLRVLAEELLGLGLIEVIS